MVALADLGEVVGLQQDLQVGVGVHVDETGREHEAVGVDHPVGGRRGAARGRIAAIRGPSTSTSAG